MGCACPLTLSPHLSLSWQVLQAFCGGHVLPVPHPSALVLLGGISPQQLLPPAILRYVLVLNATWLVNSAAHMFGNRPYDRNINPRENRLVTFGALGTLVAPFNSKPLHKVTVSETGRDHCTRH